MPQPNGYRKALRFMKHADHFGFPIVTFVDTPGAYAGKNAEELGQVRPAGMTIPYKNIDWPPSQNVEVSFATLRKVELPAVPDSIMCCGSSCFWQIQGHALAFSCLAKASLCAVASSKGYYIDCRVRPSR